MSRKSLDGTLPDGDESVRDRDAADPAKAESAGQVEALLTQPPSVPATPAERQRAMEAFRDKAWDQLEEASKSSKDPTAQVCAWEILDYMSKMGTAESNFLRSINGQPYEGGMKSLASLRRIETPEEAIDYVAGHVGGQARVYLKELKRIIANRRSIVRRERDALATQEPSA